MSSLIISILYNIDHSSKKHCKEIYNFLSPTALVSIHFHYMEKSSLDILLDV